MPNAFCAKQIGIGRHAVGGDTADYCRLSSGGKKRAKKFGDTGRQGVKRQENQ